MNDGMGNPGLDQREGEDGPKAMGNPWPARRHCRTWSRHCRPRRVTGGNRLMASIPVIP